MRNAQDTQRLKDELAPHCIEMADALQQAYLALSRYAPPGMSLRQWSIRTLEQPGISEGKRWDAEAAKRIVEVLDKITPGFAL